ncbi:MAG: 2Fe-2S iron-sulfur cluster binding domain-containing protein [Rhodocyclales bacterium]|nr:2Fe-2S iron-sulfur cluster binding domain-containing protein [Rhodocyclales bacterium]
MTQLLSLARAAQLIGVTRGSLQEKIRNGELAAFDGMVTSEELLRVFPDIEIEVSGAFEHVTRIKEQAFGKRVRQRMLPSQEVLAQRLFAQSQELDSVRRHLARYHELLGRLSERVAAMGDAGRDLGVMLDDGLALVLGSQDKDDTVAVMDEILRVITAQVTVRPSGHEFFVEGSETILEAALHAGLAPAYGCGNGNCGLCKARVVSGETRQIRNTDYPLSEVERTQNYKLLCSHTAVSDLVIEMVEAQSAADIPEQQIVAKVKSVSPLDAHTFLLHLQTPRTNRLRFMAGQGVTLGYAGGSVDFRGDYPLASCPCDDRNLLFHVTRADAEAGDGFAARLFAGAVHAGDAVDVWGPYGDFVLKPESGRALAFLCCDAGFAPVRSLVEHSLALDVFPAITVCWAATRPGGQYLANQCRAWADALDGFDYLPVEAIDAATAGRAAVERLAGMRGLAECDIYVAGDEAFVAAAVADLNSAGVPEDRIAATVL